MELTKEEKSMRLQIMLKEALKPMLEKIDKLEQEIKEMKENQEEIRNIVSSNTKTK
ncbi:hypothetical protein [Bacillus dakarensis]|uniref:hypothetical protein n=1 Tax=Robertmurraya dakarensis TaxID=1926278 RepID=UPI0012B6A753|nr:hypothetical protein [Bacillus dakarensis]